MGGLGGVRPPLEDFAYVVNSDVRGGRYYIRPPLEPRPMPIYERNVYYITYIRDLLISFNYIMS